MRRGGWILTLLGGLGLGVGLGWALWGGQNSAATETSRDETAFGSVVGSRPNLAPIDFSTAESPAAPVQPLELAPGARGPGPAPVGDSPTAAPQPALIDADRAFVEARIAEVAASFRRAGQAQIDGAEASARAQVERQLGEERAAREDLARGGTMAFLKQNAKKGTHWELLSDARAYRELFRRKVSGARVEGTSLRADTELAAGDRVVYPPGQFALDVRALNRRPFPADVVFEGQSMDQTLLVFNDELRLRGDIHSLTFRDLTLHCGDNYLEALRDGAYTLRLDRCRVIGFDMGAGGSSMLSGSVGAFLAEGCKIEAGFGRAPGFGNLFDVRGGLLARLEDCEIVGPFRSVWYQGSGASHVFDHCRFRAMDPGWRARFADPPDNVRLLGCTFEFLPEGTRDPKERRSLAEINPAWADTPR